MSGFTLKTYRVSGLKRPQIPAAYLTDMMTMGSVECGGHIGRSYLPDALRRADFVVVALKPSSATKRRQTRSVLGRREKCVAGFAFLQVVGPAFLAKVLSADLDLRGPAKTHRRVISKRLQDLGVRVDPTRDVTRQFRDAIPRFRGLYIDLVCSRHRGGSLLMDRVRLLARQIGATFIELHALDQAKLIRFYKANGFKHIMPPCATHREKHFEVDDEGVSKLKVMTQCLRAQPRPRAQPGAGRPGRPGRPAGRPGRPGRPGHQAADR